MSAVDVSATEAVPEIAVRGTGLRPVVAAARRLHFVQATRLLNVSMTNDSLMRNSFGIMANTVLTSAFGYLFWVIAAHAYTPRVIGLVGALISLVSVVAILANLGLGTVLVQYLPTATSDEDWAQTMNAAMIAATLAGALAGVLTVLVIPLFIGGFSILQSLPTAAVFVVGAAAWTGAVPLDYVFIAERTSGRLVARNAVNSVTKLPLLLVPVLFGATTTFALFGAWTASALIAFAYGQFVLVPQLRPGYGLRLRGIGTKLRVMTRSLVGHHFTTVGFILPTWLLPVIVVARLSARDNAYFFLTWLVGGLFFMVSPAVAASLFAEGAHDPQSIARQTRRSAAVIGGLLVGPMVFFVVFGKVILRFFGPGYPAAGYALLVVLVISAVPDAATNIAVAVMRVEGRLRTSSILTTTMGVLTLVLAWVLLPPMGIVGAGLAWLISQSVGTVYVLIDHVVRNARRVTTAIGEV